MLAQTRLPHEACSSQRLFVFGLGYSALELARKLQGDGWHISGTVRSEDKAQALRAQGIAAHVFSGAAPSATLLADLAQAPYVLQSVGLVDGKDPILSAFTPTLQAHPNLIWLGYLSTTVVYGDHQGQWVDETTVPVPQTPRGKARLKAEADWAALGLPLHIFRLAGIYGPDRNLLVKLRAGKAQTIDKPGQVFSRIHVTDIANLVHASMMVPKGTGTKPEIYNGADEESAPPADVAAFAATLLDMPPPALVPYDQATLSPMARSFYADNKRISNAKMRALMGPLTHPTYREGLTALKETLA